ncbi:RhuM family protein [Paenibacillus sp. IHBB 10380]|uniref:RhuM family protein n=1 Tax=Paenibacillus sp. IHBB 10380 TaxID=1566358 RepID=UPI0009E36FF6|nr:RhuM family protein [Paenibacillus sp. IHBB 10380]
MTAIHVIAVDYDSKAEITKDFFATVQNKLHNAIHGQIASELIVNRASANQQGDSICCFGRKKRNLIE